MYQSYTVHQWCISSILILRDLSLLLYVLHSAVATFAIPFRTNLPLLYPLVVPKSKCSALQDPRAELPILEILSAAARATHNRICSQQLSSTTAVPDPSASAPHPVTPFRVSLQLSTVRPHDARLPSRVRRRPRSALGRSRLS